MITNVTKAGYRIIRLISDNNIINGNILELLSDSDTFKFCYSNGGSRRKIWSRKHSVGSLVNFRI